jgi:hypothetical protein
MDDMQTFERRVASEVIGGMGPSEPVDDAAIFSAITTVTRFRSWRFPSLFSLTKSVAAGAIVALFGGFLLAGVLTTQPSDEQTPAVGASASGSSTPEATASVEASPNNDQVDREATTVRSDLVPGVDLVTEEVEQGVLRIISDGAGHDLDETHPSDRYDMNGIAVTPDGTVWLTTAYSGGDNDVQPTGPLVWALGRPGIYTTEDGVPEDGHTLVTESDGTLLMVGSTSIVRFDGSRFVPDDGRVVRRISTGDELWTVGPAQLAALLDEGDYPETDVTSDFVASDPRRFLAAIWIWNGDAWTTLSEVGQAMGAGDMSWCWIEGGIRCESPDIATYLEGTEIKQLAEAPDTSLWAVGGYAGEGGGLYRISPEELEWTGPTITD